MSKRVKEDRPFMNELHRRFDEILDTLARRVEYELSTEITELNRLIGLIPATGNFPAPPNELWNAVQKVRDKVQEIQRKITVY